jgi:hypothetical protein
MDVVEEVELVQGGAADHLFLEARDDVGVAELGGRDTEGGDDRVALGAAACVVADASPADAGGPAIARPTSARAVAAAAARAAARALAGELDDTAAL